MLRISRRERMVVMLSPSEARAVVVSLGESRV